MTSKLMTHRPNNPAIAARLNRYQREQIAIKGVALTLLDQIHKLTRMIEGGTESDLLNTMREDLKIGYDHANMVLRMMIVPEYEIRRRMSSSTSDKDKKEQYAKLLEQGTVRTEQVDAIEIESNANRRHKLNRGRVHA